MSEYTDLRDLVSFRPLDTPLSYPGGTRYSPFKASWSSTVALLATELRLHGAEHAVMEIDMPAHGIRQDGVPRSDRRANGPGVRLSFTATKVPGKPPLRYEATEFSTWQDNFRAVALALRALRAVDRYGITRRGEQYAGWKALTAGVGDGDPARGRRLIDEAGSVAKALFAAHPDHGGSEDDFRDVIAARDALKVAA